VEIRGEIWLDPDAKARGERPQFTPNESSQVPPFTDEQVASVDAQLQAFVDQGEDFTTKEVEAVLDVSDGGRVRLVLQREGPEAAT